MRWEEAESTFSRARKPDWGKPLPGKEVRLYQKPDRYVVEYHSTPVVQIYPDGTYLLDHGGYASRMTKIRMEEYAPVRLYTVGKRGYKQKKSFEEPWFGYDNLMLRFDCPILPGVVQTNIFYDVFPERFKRFCTLEFPRQTLHVDHEGKPVVDSLLAQIAPSEWKHLLEGRLQPWEMASAIHGRSYALATLGHSRAFQEVALEPGETPSSAPGKTLVMVRRAWQNNGVVASVWRQEGRAGAPALYHWVIPSSDLSGRSSDLTLAVQQVDAALRDRGWSSAPPLLQDVLGDLRTQLGYVEPIPGQALLPFGGPILLERPVLRAHWMEPWNTYEQVTDKEGYYVTFERPVKIPRQPLPGAFPWPGSEEVRVWFELVDGTAVGIVYDEKTKKNMVRLSHVDPSQRTTWDVPFVLAAGLIGSVLALLVL